MNLDREYILNLAKEILLIPSPSGFTKEITKRIELEADLYSLEYTRTKKGNTIITYPGTTDYTVGLSVHVDTLGAMVRSISATGEIKFTTIGGPIWPTLDGEYCTIQTRENKSYISLTNVSIVSIIKKPDIIVMSITNSTDGPNIGMTILVLTWSRLAPSIRAASNTSGFIESIDDM